MKSIYTNVKPCPGVVVLYLLARVVGVGPAKGVTSSLLALGDILTECR